MSENRRHREKGQSLVLVAAAMVALVMFVAVAVDLGNAYYARRTAQNAADGAALAGVSVMATGINKNNPKLDDDIAAAMNDFAERNGIEDTTGAPADEDNNNVEGWYVDVDGNRLPGEPMVGVQAGDDVPPDAYGVEAIAHITATAFFGGIFGMDGYPLQARAVSQLRLACGSDCVVPITTDVSLLMTGTVPMIGECFNIWRESQTDVPTPGLYGWVNWTWQEEMCGEDGDGRPCPEVDQGTNACDSTVLALNLDPIVCASGFIQVDDWMSSTSGVVNANDVRCLLDYYLGIPHPIEECGVSSDVPRPFTIPVYDETNMDEPYNCTPIPCLRMKDLEDVCSGGLHYRVAGFARMQILGYQLSQGEGSVSVGHDGTGCVTIGEIPSNGNRITAEFLEYVQDYDTSNECYDPAGTLWSSPKLTE